MRKTKIIAGVAIGLLVIAVAGVWALLDVNRFHDRIQSQLEQQLARKVTLGNMSLRIFPLRFQVENPAVGEDPRFGKSSLFVSADKLDVAVELLPLWNGNVQINSLDLQRPTVELIKAKDGTWNFSSLGAAGRDKNAGSAPTAASKPHAFALDNLQIHDGKIAVSDAAAPKSRTVYDHVDLSARIRFDEAEEGLLRIEPAKITISQTPISIAGSIKTNATPPQLDLRATLGDVSLAEILRMASALGLASAPAADIAGHVKGDVRIRGSSSHPALDGTVNARDIRVSGKNIPQPVEIPAVDLSVTPSEVRSNNFIAKSGKTTATGHLAVRQYSSNSPAIDLALKAPNATLPEIQSFAKAWGMSGLDPLSGSGAMNLDLHAAGPLQSLSSPALVKALNGDLNLNFDTLHIAGFDAAQELATIAGFLKPDQQKRVTDILKLTGHIAVKNGIAETNDLQAQLDIGKVTANGTADLDQTTLNLRLNTVVPKAISDKVGGTRVGGYMKTALSNPDGELIIPALVTGTFSNPRFSPDTKTFLQMQKTNLLPGLVNSVTTSDKVKGIFGGLFGGKKEPEKK